VVGTALFIVTGGTLALQQAPAGVLIVPRSGIQMRDPNNPQSCPYCT
jgi:hypothetical protein